MGANLEAGIWIEASRSHQVIADAISHLEACRDEAEVFDPDRIEVYKGIQGGRGKGLGEKVDILVINAEAHVQIEKHPFTIQVRVHSEEFDNHLMRDRTVHLYLHPPGSLTPGAPFDLEKATLWAGQVAGVTNTERHPRNRGERAELPRVDYELEVLEPPLRLLKAGPSGRVPISQGVLRLDHHLEQVREDYSISSEPLLGPPKLVGVADEILLETDRDMLQFFTRHSRREGRLVYQPAERVERKMELVGYPEIVGPSPQSRRLPDGGEVEMYPQLREPKNPLEPFFFVSRYHLPRR